MNRGVEIDSDVADLPQAADRGAGDERHRGPHVAAVPACWAARGEEAEPMPERDPRSRGARVVDPAAGPRRRRRRAGRGRRRSRRSAPGRPADGAETIDCDGLGPRARARRPAHASARAGLRAQGDGRDRHARRRGRAATPRSRRWRTPIPSPTTRASSPRSARRPPRPGSCDVFPVGAITKGLEGESLAEMGEMVDGRACGCSATTGTACRRARLLRNALTYAKAFPDEIVIAEHCEDAALVEGGQMHEGVQLLHARPGRPPGRGRGDRRGARPRAGAADRRAAPRLPRVVRASRWS